MSEAVTALGEAITAYQNSQEAGKKSSTTPDIATLVAKIADAEKEQVSKDGSDVLTTEKWTTQAALDAFTKAIATARTVPGKSGVTQDEVNEAVIALDNAI